MWTSHSIYFLYHIDQVYLIRFITYLVKSFRKVYKLPHVNLPFLKEFVILLTSSKIAWIVYIVYTSIAGILGVLEHFGPKNLYPKNW